MLRYSGALIKRIQQQFRNLLYLNTVVMKPQFVSEKIVSIDVQLSYKTVKYKGTLKPKPNFYPDNYC